jgi:hypothetical protein
MKVFLGGEGPDELGRWFREPPYDRTPPGRGPAPTPGILEALLQKIAPDSPTVIGACVWKRIRKLRFGSPIEAETHNVLGLMLEAEETGADVLLFVRDQDRDPERREAIEQGLRRAQEANFSPEVVGGVAVEEIEAWLLAMLGERRSPLHADPKAVLAKKHHISDRAGKVAVVEGADLDRIPEDAESLLTWLRAARETFAAS